MIAYYIESFDKGIVYLLAVDEDYQHKGYARDLLHYAILDLENCGATSIKLLTHLKNERARALYERFDFEEVQRFDEFISYQLNIAPRTQAELLAAYAAGQVVK